MKLPKMIMFDYGQTLVNERTFDGIKGTEAVMKYAAKNKHNYSAEEIQAAAESINDELGRYDPARRHLYQVEVPNSMFTPYLYEALGIEVPLSVEEVDKIFWNAAAPGVPTVGIIEFLGFLKEQGIRTGVISNIAYCSEAVQERIDSVITNHEFEFIIATSKYMFRKPHKRIFELALEKADLAPEDVWYIGDNYACDVEGARNAGIFPIWYIGAVDVHSEREDVLTIRNWEELRNMMFD